MHYYTHHIGDYKRDTSHLSLLEHGIYRQLLDLYYLNETPIDANQAMRLIGCRTDAEREATQTILNEFFKLTENGYTQNRCESEIQRIYDKSDKARENAKARWDKVKNADAMQTHSEGNADAMLPNTQYPIPNLNTSSSDKSDNCPHNEIVSLYHEMLPSLPRIKTWTDKRKRLLQARWREETKRQDLDYWKRFFDKVSRSDFLMGRTKVSFVCNLEWLVNSSNFVKVIEGNYDNR